MSHSNDSSSRVFTRGHAGAELADPCGFVTLHADHFRRTAPNPVGMFVDQWILCRVPQGLSHHLQTIGR